MEFIRIENNCYLIEMKFSDLLKVGHEFQGETIVKIENVEKENIGYFKVTTQNPRYSI